MKIIRNGLTLLLALYSVGCASVSRLMGLEQGHILVTYYAPAWGPDTNGSEVVYFLKQVTFESESQQRTRIYFCSIKPDGTDRKEITWLWRDQPDQFFENFSSAVTMDVNAATRRAAIGVQLGQRSGIFIVGLDGQNFRSLWPKEWNQDRPHDVGYPTWSPDGQWVAFGEVRDKSGMQTSRIVKYRLDGTGYEQLTESEGANGNPAWSPNGDSIAYVNFRGGKEQGPYLWLMKPDGTEKRDTKEWGRYPRWSPDGKFILHDTYSVIDPTSGQLVRRYPYLKDGQGIQMYPKWGYGGFVFVDYLKIGLTNLDGDTTVPLLKNVSRRGSLADLDKEAFRW
jgi:hypothetical protein